MRPCGECGHLWPASLLESREDLSGCPACNGQWHAVEP